MRYQAVDCLGFAGGFTLGAVRAGFELVGKRELPGGFGVPNCEANRHLLGTRWVTEIGPAESWSAVQVPLVFGNPPCSGFSVMTAKEHRGVDARVNACMWNFSTYAASCAPEIVIMESVRQAFHMGHELMRQLRANLEERTGHRYDLWHVFQDAITLGGAANRPRYFWVASRIPFGVEYPRVRRPLLPDVIGDLEDLSITWEGQPHRRPPTWWSRRAREGVTAVDGHVPCDSLYVRRSLELLTASEAWPEGAHIAQIARAYWERHGEGSLDAIPLWAGQEAKLRAKNWHMGFTSMTRWRRDQPGRVITGAALDAVMHPTEPRTITHREAARVMGFPDDWLIAPLRDVSGLRRTWGKGITVQCGEWVAAWARRALDGEPGSITGVPVGDREWLISERPIKIKSATMVGTQVNREVAECLTTTRGAQVG